MKPRLLATRPLLLKVPHHPDRASSNRAEGDDSETSTVEGRAHSPFARGEAQRRRQEQEQERKEEKQELERRHQEQRERQEQLECQQRQQEQEQNQELQRQRQQQQQQLLKSTQADTSLGSSSGTRSPKRPHVARRIANRVVTAVREGTKIILQTSPRHILKSHGAAGLAITAAAGFRDGKRPGGVKSAGEMGAEGVVSPRQEWQEKYHEQQEHRELHHRVVHVSKVAATGSEPAEGTDRTGFRREVTAWRQTPEDFPDTKVSVLEERGARAVYCRMRRFLLTRKTMSALERVSLPN